MTDLCLALSMIAHWQPSTSLRAQKEPYTSQVKPQHRSTNQSTTPCCVFPYIRASRVSNVSNSMPPWQDVIRVLLRKFRVADNPHKYALYERQDDYRGDRCELFSPNRNWSFLSVFREVSPCPDWDWGDCKRMRSPWCWRCCGAEIMKRRSKNGDCSKFNAPCTCRPNKCWIRNVKLWNG